MSFLEKMRERTRQRVEDERAKKGAKDTALNEKFVRDLAASAVTGAGGKEGVEESGKIDNKNGDGVERETVKKIEDGERSEKAEQQDEKGEKIEDEQIEDAKLTAATSNLTIKEPNKPFTKGEEHKTDAMDGKEDGEDDKSTFELTPEILEEARISKEAVEKDVKQREGADHLKKARGVLVASHGTKGEDSTWVEKEGDESEDVKVEGV